MSRRGSGNWHRRPHEIAGQRRRSIHFSSSSRASTIALLEMSPLKLTSNCYALGRSMAMSSKPT